MPYLMLGTMGNKLYQTVEKLPLEVVANHLKLSNFTKLTSTDRHGFHRLLKA
jgi:hypothetical protein